MNALAISAAVVVGYIAYRMSPGSIKGRKSLTLYYSLQCPHCVEFLPTWLLLGTSVNGVTLRMIQGSGNEYPIQYVPTLVYRDAQGNTEEYSGQRTAAGVRAYLATK